MSWFPEILSVRRRLHRVLAVAGVAIVLAGCAGGGFAPLYGVSENGSDTSSVLASVEIVPIPGRIGQQLRNELLFRTRGGGQQLGDEYKLQIAIRESDRTIFVEQDADSRGRIYKVISKFQLIRNSDGKVVLEGNNHARAAYRKFDSIYANLRARRDAENRAAKDSARAISTRVAAYLSQAA